MIMRQVRWASGTVALAMALAICGVGPAAGDVASDRAAAIVMWPHIQVGDVTGELSSTQSIETVLQLTNTSDQPVVVWCFYENANSHCTNTGEVCVNAQRCCMGGNGCGQCLPDWNEVDFRIRLTPQQPIGWLASEGEADFPLDGRVRTGIGGSSNAGSRIPPVPEEPFEGLLKCIAVDEDNTPVERNVLKGEATLYFVDTTPSAEQVDIGKYNAVGIQAREGRLNDDKTLILDSDQNPDAEYNGCPNVLILNHFFDFATNPVNDAEIETNLILVPCTQDLLRQIPGSAVIQYIVYNEFEQRFSTSRTARCKQNLPLSLIDTTQRERSIFSAGVAGTLTGQTRASAIGSGMLAVAEEFHTLEDVTYTADFNVHFQGDREEPDTIILP
jgi:hypothetical protein